MSRVVILGGAGFIGRWLCGSLLDRGREVMVIDRVEPERPVVEWIRGDARDAGLVGSVISPDDVLVHLFHSSIPAESMGDAAAEQRENVAPFRELLRMLSEKPVARLVYSSSGGQVYGEAKSLPIRESHPLEPVSEYGRAKLAMEDATRDSGLPYLIVRVANPYGPWQEKTNRHGVIPHLIRAAVSGSPFQAYGAGEAERDYIYIEDVAEALADLICGDHAGMAVNVGSGKGVGLEEIIARIEKLSGREIDARRLPLRPSDVRANVLDISLLKSLAGREPATDLGQGLARTWEHMTRDEKA